MAAWIGLGAAVVFLALWAAQTRRTLAALDANVVSAMDQIGVQLSSRIDALTTLTRQLEPYDGEAARRMSAMLCQCRGTVTGVSGPGEVQRQEDVIQTVIEQVRTVAGQHPEVRADARCTGQWQAVESYGKMLCTSHLIYNDSAEKLNRCLGRFPAVLLAKALGIHKRGYIKAAPRCQR